ncbi:MAG: hypothetical protein K8R59_10000 [Thermoanaerobaculales bacterium]|nr:hypothetical protein [Thermoanaerobaculales bacterium]
MELNRRRRLKAEKVEIPDHFEGVPLRRGVLLAGWILGPGCGFLGIGLMVKAEGSWIEAVGALLAAVGCLLIAGVVRCRRFEIEIGRRWVKVGAGPLGHRFPAEMVGAVEKGPARSWRRLFGNQELRIRLRSGPRDFIIPSREPQETIEALQKATKGAATKMHENAQ